jgi:hypothetical protein
MLFDVLRSACARGENAIVSHTCNILQYLYNVDGMTCSTYSNGKHQMHICYTNKQSTCLAPSIISDISAREDTEISLNAPRIDSRYVNNSDMADIRFVIEGRIFYAHKIVLVNASQTFAQLLKGKAANEKIDIQHTDYEVFEVNI